MLGALSLLLGNRAESKVLFDPGKKCVIEGQFDVEALDLEDLFTHYELDYFTEAILRREISPSGKSRAFINDTPVTLEVMKAVGSQLVDIHSQRDTYLLGSSDYQLRMIDNYAQCKQLFHEYTQAYKLFKSCEEAYNNLLQESELINKEADYNHFLFEELEKANVIQGEQDSLEEESRIIEHAEEIKKTLFESMDILDKSEYAINPGINQVVRNIQSISTYAEHFIPLRDRLESCMHELHDIAQEIESEVHKVEFDPARQDEINERLSLLYQLYKKHQVQSESELLEIHNALSEKVNSVQHLDQNLAESKSNMEKAEEKMIKVAKKLSKVRRAEFTSFKQSLESHLQELAMPNSTIEVRHEACAPNANGIDKIGIFFSANAGIAPGELKKVASGGEFSRLMFSIKYLLAGKTSLPTIIFDEIDSGISGEVALKMVKMMKSMSERHQVIAITHLPQIAAQGQNHYFVYKENSADRSETRIRQLDAEQRVEAIAKMIGGDNPSEVAMENARELLNI